MPLQIEHEHIAMPNYIWAWRMKCPRCGRKTLAHMTEDQLQERHQYLTEESDGCIFTGPNTCQACESQSYIRFQVDEDGLMVGCLTPTDEIEREMHMSVPERIELRSKN